MSRALPALLLSVWLSGAGCLLCCEGESANSFAAAAEVSELAETAHSCCKAVMPDAAGEPSGHYSEVEGKLTASPLAGFSPRTGEARGCCRRNGQTLDAARKPRLSDGLAAVASASAGHSLPCERVAEVSAKQDAEVPDRGGTYLKICVFLI